MAPPPDLSGADVTPDRLEVHARAMLSTFGLYMNTNAMFAPSGTNAMVDAFLFSNDVSVGVCEAKLRVKYTLPELHEHGAIYPIPEARVERLAKIANDLGIPGFLVVRLRDGTCWYWKVSDGQDNNLSYQTKEKMGRRFALLRLTDATMWAQFDGAPPETERLLRYYRVATEMESLD